MGKKTLQFDTDKESIQSKMMDQQWSPVAHFATYPNEIGDP